MDLILSQILIFTLLSCSVIFRVEATPLTWKKIVLVNELTASPKWPAFGYYKPNRNFIMFGGKTAFTITDSLHTCQLSNNGNTCTWATPLTYGVKPQARWAAFSGINERERIFVVSCGQGKGQVSFNDVWYLDLDNMTWREVPMRGVQPVIRYGGRGGFAKATSTFFITMGFGGVTRTSDAYTIDFTGIRNKSSLNWVQVGDQHNSYNPFKPHSRCLLAGTMVGSNNFVMYGGCLKSEFISSGGPCPSYDGWSFNLDSREWKELPRCLTPRFFSTMSQIPNNNQAVLMYGGKLNTNTVPTVISEPIPQDEVVVLTLNASSQWLRKKSLPDPLNGLPHWRHSHSMDIAENRIYIYGGTNEAGDVIYSDMWSLSGDFTENEDYSCPMYYFTVEIAHGILMFLGWGVFLQLGAFIARYLRFKSKVWFYFHVTFNSTGLILALIGFIIIFLKLSKPIFAHGIIGIVTMLLGCWQPLNAIFRPHIDPEGEKKKRRILWEWIHKLSGRFALILALLNITLGMFLIVSPLYIWISWLVLLFLLICAYVVFEVGYWIKYCLNRNKHGHHKLTEKNSIKLEDL